MLLHHRPVSRMLLATERSERPVALMAEMKLLISARPTLNTTREAQVIPENQTQNLESVLFLAYRLPGVIIDQPSRVAIKCALLYIYRQYAPQGIVLFGEILHYRRDEIAEHLKNKHPARDVQRVAGVYVSLYRAPLARRLSQ